MGVSEKRRSTRVREDEVTVRRCRACRIEKELEQDFYVERRDTHGEIAAYCYRCKVCQVAYSTALRKRQRRDPERGPEIRKQQREWAAAWRKQHPELNAKIVHRYRERLKRDPQRYAASLEAQRMRNHLKAEREGRHVGRPQPVARHLIRFTKGPIYNANPNLRVPHPDGGDCIEVWRGPYERRGPQQRSKRMPPDVQNELPAKPLAERIMGARQFYDREPNPLLPLEEFCKQLGITARTLLRWRNEPGHLVQFDVADKVLTRLDLLWFDVWSPEEFPDVAERLAA